MATRTRKNTNTNVAIENLVVETAPTPTTTIFAVLEALPGSIRGQIAGALSGTVNISVINAAVWAMPETLPGNGIDGFNEMMAELAVKKADAKAIDDMGLESRDPVAELVNLVRFRFALADYREVADRRTLLPLGNSMQFMLSGKVRLESDENIELLHQFSGMDKAYLRAASDQSAKQKDAARKARLQALEQEIFDLVSLIEQTECPEQSIDDAFKALPAATQYRLSIKIITAISNQVGSVITSNMGILEKAGLIGLLKNTYNAAITHLDDWYAQHPELADVHLPDIPQTLA